MPGGGSRSGGDEVGDEVGNATLSVQVHEARKLKPGLDGTSNAYAKVKVTDGGSRSRKTNVVADSGNPKWDDDTFEFSLPAPASRRGSVDWSQLGDELVVEVWSQEEDRMGDPTDRLIGDRRYALSRFAEAEGVFERQWCALTDHGGQLRLSVVLERPGGGGGRGGGTSGGRRAVADSDADSDGGGGGGGGGENPALRRAFDAERKGVTTRNAPTLIRKISKKPMLSSMHRKIATFAREEGLASNDPFDFETFQRLYESLYPPSSSRSGASPSRASVGGSAPKGLARGDAVEARYGGKSAWYAGGGGAFTLAPCCCQGALL